MSDISHNENATAVKDGAAEGFVPIEISAPMVDLSLLAGRYSESFIDMIGAAVTQEIERLLSVEGLVSSGVRLNLVFAPETYMEHTSESVTYRRLLLSYGQGAPRDLWVKWTRLDADGEAYSLSDTPDPDSVLIEISEDVPQKVREKEYRFLARSTPDKYRAAMGKRNVTEWRELIKRAVKCGDLARVEKTVKISEETAALSDKLAAVLGISEPPVSETEVHTECDDIAELARAVLGLDAKETSEVSFDEPDEPAASFDEPSSDDIFDLTEMEEIISDTDEAVAETLEAEPCEQKLPECEPTDVAMIYPTEDIPVEETETPIEEAEAPVEQTPESTAAVTKEELEARIRAELEAKIRLEYESRARRQAEEEADRLRLENERLREMARLEKEKWESERAAGEERIRQELELRLRDESRERERLAEAARAALYEREVIETERAREAERRAAEELAERERIERERETERIERERAAEAERLRREVEGHASEKVEKKYTYTKKTVLLLFRRSVDPNVTSRIYEIIKATVDYYGKGDVYIRVKASLPDSTTVRLDFVEIPVEEMELLTNIIKVLGNSGLGIAKAKIQ